MHVNETGDYAFCFGGRKLTSSMNVHFDFDPEIENTIKQDIEKRFSAEKRRFLNRILHNVKFGEKYKEAPFNLTEQFMMDVVRNHKDEIVHKNPDVGVEVRIYFLLYYIDRDYFLLYYIDRDYFLLYYIDRDYFLLYYIDRDYFLLYYIDRDYFLLYL